MGSKEIKQTYVAAGIDIDVAARAKELIKRQAHTTHRSEVLGGVGFFGGLFEFKGYKQPILVSSVDGVGTKLKIAAAVNKHETIGIDLVNHCVNDILTCGAEPLFFLDYIAMGKLVPDQVAAVARGLAQACREAGCALIGGETAEMPGLYAGEDYDLVGFIIGVVEKEKIILGKEVKAGDAVIGLPSSGLHTNGYSLVRKIFGVEELAKSYPGLGRTLGEALLEPHRCYYTQLRPRLSLIKGMAHITGGGLVDNVPRVLPEGLAARFDSQSWTVPSVFRLIQQRGNVEQSEMYRVFNMGIGMVLISSPDDAGQLTEALPEAKVIGGVAEQVRKERVVID
ncbi:MAG: phosphoribosylformylglycinamidine cyclo-ligase [Dehalococcoidales bacterium]|jgi:phosphoribosylformylglycinamidine cyclo-ligase|nr:phosphoribosylformylglycinamidine cyclo-ligase [Dehalococcoidales bacterium]MDP7415981.1 phosphoribosylformylglycinamidine cyclo-ligase [Dehalococcoidales bacterium]